MGFTRKALNWYAKLSPRRGKTSPPYEHVIQIGDPVLRRISEPIALDKIKSNEIQSILHKLEYVIKVYGSVGISAPQIGVNLRIFAMRYTAKQFSGLSKEVIQRRGISEVPYTVCL